MERFWSKVSPEPNTGCWLWTATVSRGGYGNFGLNGRMVLAPRVAWRLTHGQVPDGVHVLHRCDQPACVNPDHLFLGSRSDNMRDCARKRRHAAQKRPEIRRGERNGRAKLTAAQVTSIRDRYAAGSVSRRALAREFGVAHGTIDFIVDGGRWR